MVSCWCVSVVNPENSAGHPAQCFWERMCVIRGMSSVIAGRLLSSAVMVGQYLRRWWGRWQRRSDASLGIYRSLIEWVGFYWVRFEAWVTKLYEVGNHTHTFNVMLTIHYQGFHKINSQEIPNHLNCSRWNFWVFFSCGELPRILRGIIPESFKNSESDSPRNLGVILPES